jgi:hypothetical protein
MTSLYDFEASFYLNAEEAPRLRAPRAQKLAPAKNHIIDAMSVVILGIGATEAWRTFRFIIHAVSDANTTQMILHWLKSLLG